MFKKSLIRAKRYLLSAILLSLIFSTSVIAQTQNFLYFIQDPSKRFGANDSTSPSLRYMPTKDFSPAKRYGVEQVGEASLEKVKRVSVQKAVAGPEQLIARADKLVEDKQTEKAIEIYQKVLSNNKLASAHLGLGTAFLDLEKYDEAIKEINLGLSLDPNDREGQINLGVALYRSGQITEATSHYEKLIASTKAESAKERRNLASINYNLAIAYAHQGNFEKAINTYKQAINLRQDFAEAYNNLALIYEVEGNLDEAKKNILMAIEKGKGNYPLAHYNLARLYFRQGNYLDAEQEFLLATKQKTDFAEAYLDLGNTYILQTRTNIRNVLNQAIDSYKKAIEVRKNYYALAHENLAIALSLNNQVEEAYKHYRIAMDQYTEASINTLYNIMSTKQRKTAFAIDNELSRLEDVRNLRKIEKKDLINKMLSILEQYEAMDEELKDVVILRYCAGHAYVSVENWEAAIDEFEQAWELSNKTDKEALKALTSILELVKYY